MKQSTVDFYVGKGETARWLGGTTRDPIVMLATYDDLVRPEPNVLAARLAEWDRAVANRRKPYGGAPDIDDAYRERDFVNVVNEYLSGCDERYLSDQGDVETWAAYRQRESRWTVCWDKGSVQFYVEGILFATFFPNLSANKIAFPMFKED